MAPWKCFAMLLLQSPLLHFICGVVGMQITGLMLYLAHRDIEGWAYFLVSVVNAIVVILLVQRGVGWLARQHYLEHTRLAQKALEEKLRGRE